MSAFNAHPVKQSARRLAVLLVVLAIGVAVLLIVPRSPTRPQMAEDERAEASVQAMIARTRPSARESMAISLLNDASPATRHAAVDELATYRDAGAARALEAAFADSSSAVRAAALQTLVLVDKERGKAMLLRALADSDTEVRETALVQLRTIADRRAVPALIPLVNDPSQDVQLLAMRLLAALTGRQFVAKVVDPPAKRREAAAKWRDWWTAAASTWPRPNDPSAFAPVLPTRSDPAPPVSLRGLDGQRLSVAGFRGRVLLLNFWATWCPPCRTEMPDIADVFRALHSRGLEMVGADVGDEDVAMVRDWAAKHGIAYRMALGDDDVATRYEAHEIPVTVLIDRQGRIRYRWDGPVDRWTLLAAARRLLAER